MQCAGTLTWPPLSPGIKYITIESESEVGGNRESESQKLETANEEWNLGSCSPKGVELECVSDVELDL